MTTIKIDNFAGISPRNSNRLQPYNGAVVAANCKLLSGELRGLRETQLLHDFGTTPVEAFAGAELARYIEAVAGVRPPVVREGEWDGVTPVLSVGNTRAYLACLTPLADGRSSRNSMACAVLAASRSTEASAGGVSTGS